jgi:Rad3-related DNA helicase
MTAATTTPAEWDPDGDHEPWPEWVEGFRQHQIDAAEEILRLFDEGVKVVVLDAPTGSGKTLIAEMVRRRLRKKDTRAVYVCTTKGLQEQIVADFPYAKVLKGRANYPTQTTRVEVASADDCARSKECGLCPDGPTACPYQIARLDTMDVNTELVALNTALWLTSTNLASPDHKGDVVNLMIVDEADELESSLMGFVKAEIGTRAISRLRMTPPKKGVHRKTLLEWIGRALDEMPSARKRVGGATVARQRELRQLARIGSKLRDLKRWMVDEPDNWIREYPRSGGLEFVPVRVAEFGEQMIWRHADRWLCMSATIINAEQWARDLGLKRDEWEVVRVPMTFPVENRPIKLMPRADVTAKKLDVEIHGLINGVAECLDKHRGENILVHTVSYSLAARITQGIKNRYPDRNIYTYSNAREREQVLARFKQTGGVLIASSMERGVDLPDDLCTVTIIAKMPFQSLGDRQVAARLRTPDGESWYRVNTARALVQMTGRGVRHAGDRCVTYILDRQFSRWWKQGGDRLLPEWWRDALS